MLIKIVLVLTVLMSVSLTSANLADAQGQDSAHATGYVHVQQIDGAWWFVGPDGDKFVSLGVNHIEPHLWLAPYNKAATLDRYGQNMVTANGRFDTTSTAAKKWIDRQVEICGDLHFNTFGKHTHPSIDHALYRDQIYYVAAFETSPAAHWHLKNGEGPLPDVFSDHFASFLTTRVEEVVGEHRESRKLLGYYITDIPDWELPKYARKQEDEYVMIFPWLNALMKLGVTSPGKQRWIEHLKSRYENAEDAAKVWGLPISPTYGTSWEKLARSQQWFEPKDQGTAHDDMLSFMPQIADQWYRLHHEAIRKLDKNHLIFGDKNMVEIENDFLIESLKKYVDVVVVQSYNPWSKDAEAIAILHQRTGKPIFNGDGCFAYVHPKQSQLKVKGWWTGAKNLEDVSEMYRQTLEGMMAQPYVIGWHHCGILQQWDDAERGDVASNENGFMDPFEKYYTSWTNVIRETNSAAVRLHESSANANK
jgi:hypothetical protein